MISLVQITSSNVVWILKIRTVFSFLSLFALWLLMSGLFKPLLVILGLFSCAICVWITHRLNLTRSGKAFFSELRFFAFVKYLFWLVVEIGKADWAVTKAILSPELPKRQRLIAVPATEGTDLAKTLFANSITITPGTVTVETEADHFIVHALTDEAANMDSLKDMNARVCAIEHPGAKA